MPAHEYGGGVLAYSKAEKFFPAKLRTHVPRFAIG